MDQKSELQPGRPEPNHPKRGPKWGSSASTETPVKAFLNPVHFYVFFEFSVSEPRAKKGPVREQPKSPAKAFPRLQSLRAKGLRIKL